MVDTGMAVTVMDGPSTASTHAWKEDSLVQHHMAAHAIAPIPKSLVTLPRAERAAKANFI